MEDLAKVDIEKYINGRSAKVLPCQNSEACTKIASKI